jgi:hypothetical protein
VSQSLALYRAARGALLDNYSARATMATFATNEHGFAESRVSVPMSLVDAFRVYDRPGLPELALYDGAAVVHAGRLEDVALSREGLDLSAYGYQNAFRDAPYTALWSTTRVDAFRPFLATEVAGVVPDRYAFDTNNRIFIAPQKNAVLGNTAGIKPGMIGFLAPDQGTRDIIGVSFDYEFVAPAANWRVAFQNRNADFSGIANPWLITSAGAGTASGTINVTFAAAPIVNFFMDFNAADAAYAGETGAAYLEITNLRLVSSTANRVNTTWSSPAGPVTGVQTVTPASMANIYVGQRLHIKQSGVTNAESVIVTAVTATTFTATFVGTHSAGETITAHVVYADEIAADLVGTISTLNPTQLSSSTALIESPGIDLLDEVYEDRLPSDILDYLIGLGDDQTPPGQWEWGVWEQQLLHFRPRGTAARAWYVDVTELELERTLSQLHNSIYATYQEAGGRTLRTAASSDSASVARYGLTRQQQIGVQSTSTAQAGVQQAAALQDGKDPIPRAGLAFDAVYDVAGARWPLWLIRSGDTITIRNLPPTLSSAIDRIRTFRIARTTYDAIAGTIQVEPESPLPHLAALLSRASLERS